MSLLGPRFRGDDNREEGEFVPGTMKLRPRALSGQTLRRTDRSVSTDRPQSPTKHQSASSGQRNWVCKLFM